MRDFPPQKMRELQTEVAELLGMQRGIDKRLSGTKRVEPRIYAKIKEAEKGQKLEKRELEANLKHELGDLKQTLENLAKHLNETLANIYRENISSIDKELIEFIKNANGKIEKFFKGLE